MTRVLVIVLALALLGGGAWFLLRKAGPGPPENPESYEPTFHEPSLLAKGRVVPGRWREARDSRPPLTPDQQEKIERLESIGYLGGSRTFHQKTGVTVHRTGRVQPGYNLYVSGHHPGAILMDMEGNVLHQWERSVADLWPEEEKYRERDFWRRAWLLPDGNLLAIVEGLGIFKLDRDSNVLWAVKNRAHHDFEVLPDGDIYVLTRKAHLMPRLHETEPILEDFVTRLDGSGRELERLSLIEAMENSHFRDMVRKGGIGSGDVFHTNTLFVIKDDQGLDAPWLRPGHLLVCFCGLHMVAAVDPVRKSVLETWAGPFRFQHDPKMLPGGRMMLFDNQGGRNGKSRVVEFDPFRRRVMWMYEGTGEDTLHSATLGTAERLPSGNILIVESDNGRALEVSRDHEILWEFRNPHRFGRYVASIFDLIRLPADFPLDWIAS